jgi:hypothetical protein
VQLPTCRRYRHHSSVLFVQEPKLECFVSDLINKEYILTLYNIVDEVVKGSHIIFTGATDQKIECLIRVCLKFCPWRLSNSGFVGAADGLTVISKGDDAGREAKHVRLPGRSFASQAHRAIARQAGRIPQMTSNALDRHDMDAVTFISSLLDGEKFNVGRHRCNA